MASISTNQQTYLNNLVQTGTSGQAAWAKSQLAAAGLTPTTPATPATPVTTNPAPVATPAPAAKVVNTATPVVTSSAPASSISTNQQAYLNSLIQTGTAGQAAWARQQLAGAGLTPVATAKPTVATTPAPTAATTPAAVPNGLQPLRSISGISWVPGSNGQAGYVSFNGQKVDPAAYGMQLINNTWYGTPTQLQDLQTNSTPPWLQAMNQLQSQIAALQDQRNQEIGQLQGLLSPQSLQTMFNNIMSAYQPSIDAYKTTVAKQLGDANNATNADVESRGLFNSGVAASLMQKNQTDAADTLASYLAEMQKNAMGQANDTLGQQLQGLATLGNWTSSDMNYLGSPIDWSKLQLDSHNSEVQNNLDQQTLNENIRQFNAKMAQDNAFHADDMQQFWANMGLQQSQLSLDQKKFALDAETQAIQTQINLGTFNTNQSLVKAQQTKDKLAVMSDAYTQIQKIVSADTGESPGQKATDARTYIAVYKDAYPDIYQSLMTDIDNLTTGTISAQ